MALILLIFGALLYFRGKITLGSIKAEGKHVKNAGKVLMFPAAASFLLSMVVTLLLAGNMRLLVGILNILYIFEIVATFLAVSVAFRLIVNPSSAPSLPGILGAWQVQQPEQEPAAPKTSKRILTLEEAAQYIGMAPAQLLALINEGKLAAARVNYRYQIARSALDDLRASLKTT